MRNSIPAKLPPPTRGKTVWPWRGESLQQFGTMADVSPWPRISIVTPSYNQGQFLEVTIRSILLQGYPNLEYFIIDGGSTDGSVEIIKQFEPWLAFWSSEKDGGQAEAINKGFAMAKGQILSWVNSDDLLMPGALHFAAQYFLDHPKVDMIYGTAQIMGDEGQDLGIWRSQDFNLLTFLYEDYICQPASFFRSKAFTDAGGLRTDLHYALDYDLWLKIAFRGEIQRVDSILGCDRKQREAKTMASPDRLVVERIKVVQEFFKSSELPPNISKLQPRVMAVHFLRAALDFLIQQKMDEVPNYLRQSHIIDPSFTPASADWVKWVLIHTGRDSATNPEAFISSLELASKLIFGDYPRCWNRMRKRARITSLTRGHLREPYLSVLGDILTAFFTDTSWSLNRKLLPDLVRLLLGSSLFSIILRIKGSLSKKESVK